MPNKPASLKVRALQWLAQREHSPIELRAKLLRLVARVPSSGQDRGRSGRPLDGAASGRVSGLAVGRGLRRGQPAGQDPTPGAHSDVDVGDDVDVDVPNVDPCPHDAEAEVDAVMTWLAAHGYLSAERFVESRVHARQARFGNLRITRELQQHGMALDPAAQQALRESEYQRARDVWQRKYGAAGVPQDAATRVRQMRFLTGRGFSPEVIRRVLRPVGSDD